MKILLVSIACPPKIDAECLQVGKYLKYLCKNKELDIEVLTSAIPTLYMPFDSSLEKYLKGVKSINYFRVWENKYFNYLIRNSFFRKFQFPDSKFLFHHQSKKALKLINQGTDLIYSRSYPLSSAVLANKIKKVTNRPWVMHLSDPWLLSPIHKYKGKTAELHAKMESECMRNADAVTFTSHKTLGLYRRRYREHENKFHFFPNVYDPDDQKKLEIRYEGKLKIAYTGGLTAKRNPSSFIKVLEKAFLKAPFLADKLEVTFAGEVDRETKEIFEKCSLPFVKYLGPLSYGDALNLQKSAHILLLIDNEFNDEEMGVFFPSKLLDYFLTNRRIFAITSKESETSNALNEYLSSCFEHQSIDQMVNEILHAVKQFELKNSFYFVSESVPEGYNAENEAARLVKLFKTLCEK